MFNMRRKQGRFHSGCHFNKSRTPSLHSSKAGKRQSLREEVLAIGIPGVDHVFKSDVSVAKRLIWGLLCAVVLVGCLIQCIERIAYYVNGYPAVRASFEHLENISFPSITICPTNELSTHPAVWPALLRNVSNNKEVNYSDAYDLMKKININVSTLWRISRLPLEDFNFSVSEGASLSSGYRMNSRNIEKKYLLTTAGTCLTMRTKHDIRHRGRLTYMSFEGQGDHSILDSTMRYRYLYHLEEDTALVQFLIPFQGIHSPYVSVQYNILRMEKLTYLNTWRNPCESDSKKYVSCVVQCLQREIFSRTNTRCRLPYMQDMADYNLPLCVTPDEFHEVYEATSDVLNSHHEASCGCPRKCKERKHSLECLSERNDTTSLFRLLIYIPDNQLGIIEEIDAYSFAALFSDIGGSMGLFLGICIIQVCEIGAIVLKSLVGGLKALKEKKAPCSEKSVSLQ